MRLCLACLLARGHLLIEDMPGVGKTTLAHALADTSASPTSASSSRATCCRPTSSASRSSSADAASSAFPGPIFAQLVLADEVNRASPRRRARCSKRWRSSRSRADGQTYPLPDPFFVDRDAEPGLPDRHVPAARIAARPLPDAHRARLPGGGARAPTAARATAATCSPTCPPTLSPQQLLRLQGEVPQVHASDALLDYVQAIARYTRQPRSSRRGCRRARRSRCCAPRRPGHSCTATGVLPEDVQAVLPAVVGHRLAPRDETRFRDAGEVGRFVLEAVPVP